MVKLLCIGDTLGQHFWGGFKEGVGVSFQKCRMCYCTSENMQEMFSMCYCTSENMQEMFSKSDFILRTRQQYDAQCREIETAPTKASRNEVQTTYGINRRSCLCELPNFDVTKQMPQDVMHTLLEGTVQYELSVVLNHFHREKFFSLDELNDAINSHHYSYN